MFSTWCKDNKLSLLDAYAHFICITPILKPFQVVLTCFLIFFVIGGDLMIIIKNKGNNNDNNNFISWNSIRKVKTKKHCSLVDLRLLIQMFGLEENWWVISLRNVIYSRYQLSLLILTYVEHNFSEVWLNYFWRNCCFLASAEIIF